MFSFLLSDIENLLQNYQSVLLKEKEVYLKTLNLKREDISIVELSYQDVLRC